MARVKSPFEKAAAKILERRNIAEAQWKKEVLQKVQFDLLRGEDKELEEYIYKREREKLILNELSK